MFEDNADKSEASGAQTTPTAPPAETTKPRSNDDVVDAWFTKHFSNLGPHLTEDNYNRLFAAKQDLKVMLATDASASN